MIKPFRRRLYLQIYLAFIGIVMLVAVFWGAMFAFMNDDVHARQTELAAAIAEGLLPGREVPATELRAALDAWHTRIQADLTLLDENGELIALAGEVIEQTERASDLQRGGWMKFRGGSITAGVRTDDGRWLLMREKRERSSKFLLGMVVVAVTIGLGAYPLARRITRRLERLGERVDALGEGDLSARVDVEGIDEVAEVARSFNRSAARIEQLVNSQRAMLAGASHELRTPLTRMRMAVELMEHGDRVRLSKQVHGDIDELDDLIEALLSASRLELDTEAGPREEVDLLVLAAEEGARTGADVGGESLAYWCEPRWLKRAVRNLLENARKYGGENVTVSVAAGQAGGAVIVVEDDGDGVPEELRELVFEPFFRPPGLREGRDNGVGLGLAIVRQICRRHGGSVVCLERPSGGTRFEMRLPATT